MKFKIGDIVKLKDGLILDKEYGGLHFTSNMRFKGTNIIRFVDDDDTYLLSNNGYWYTEEMLEDAIEPVFINFLESLAVKV